MNTPFNSMIGQEDMKRKLMFYLDGYKKTSMIPNFLFVAERGCGKTMAAIEIAKNLIVETGKPKRAKEINCSTLKSVSQFAEQVLLPFVQDNDCTILFDEASELPRDLTMSLLTMLNPNSNNRNTFNFDDMTFEIDFKRHSFIFCTTEPQKIFHALMSRLHRVDFDDYKDVELMEIVKKNIEKNSKIKFTAAVSTEIPTVLRHNPRCAQMLANDIISYCSQNQIKEFDAADWSAMKQQLGIKPMGLNSSEIKVLKILKNNPKCRLTDIGAKLGMTASAVQRDLVIFLLRNILIKVYGGRCLTEIGEKYLKVLV